MLEFDPEDRYTWTVWRGHMRFVGSLMRQAARKWRVEGADGRHVETFARRKDAVEWFWKQ